MAIPFLSKTIFKDNVKLVFGDGEDLRIYHDGSSSRIADGGTGNLVISGTNLILNDTATGENFLRAVSNGAVQLYYDGAEKFKTTNTGIDVTGTTNLDNLTINGAQGTDGQVLTSTGSGIAWEDASGGLSGGEANKVAVWSATDTLTHHDNFHFDTTNVRLGIGDSNPNRTLVVSETRTGSTASDAYTAIVKSVQSSGASPNPGTGGLKVQYTSSSSNVHAFGLVAGSSSSDFLTTGPMHFYTNSDLDTVSATGFAMTIDTAQRVGIGLTNPSQKLTVSGNVMAGRYYGNGSTAFWVDPNDSTTAARLASGLEIGYGGNGEYRIEVGEGRTGNGYAYIDFVGDTTYSDYGLRLIRNNSGANTSSQLLHRGSGNLEFKTSEAGTMIFSTSNSERMRIGSAGNVGINTTNPSAKLDITQTATAQGIKIRSSSVQPEITFIDGATGDSFAIGHNRSGSRMDIEINGTDTHTFKQNGNVGIGTTNPSFKLHVEGNSYINATSDSANLTLGRYTGKPSIKAATDDSGYLIMDSTGGRAALNWYSSDHVVLGNGGGNVGIGEHTPAERLHISGSVDNDDVAIRIDNDSDDNSSSTPPSAAVLFNTASNNGYVRVFGAPADTAANHKMDIGSTAGSSYLTFSPSSSEKMRIASSGNVGINVTSPQARLHVDAPSLKAASLTFGAQAGQIFQNENSEFAFGLHNASPYPLYIQGRTHTNGARQIALNPLGGNIGIGTLSPSRPLHVAAASSTAIVTLQRTNTNTTGGLGALQWTASDDHSVASISVVGDGNNEGGHMDFRTTSAATNNDPYSNSYLPVRMRITSDGKVGIGYTPESAHGNFNTIINGSSPGKFHLGYGTNGDNYYTTGSNGTHIFRKNTTEQMRISSAGNVGIGTLSPGYKLDVQGQIRLKNLNHQVIFHDTDSGVDEWSITTYGNTGLSFFDGATTGSAVMTLLSGGNVGIGTTSPDRSLVINHASDTRVKLQVNGTDTAQIQTLANQARYHALGSSASLQLWTNGAERARIDTSGDMGIGTTSPDEKLHVYGNTRITSRLYNTQHTSSSLSANNWYRIIEITGGSGRGKCEFSIGGSGGSGTPSLVKATVNTAWSNANSTIKVDFNSKSSAFSEFRVVRNSSSNKSFVDVKLGAAEDSVLLQVYPIAWDSAYAVDFTNVTTLPSGDSVETSVPLTNTAFALANNNGSDVDPVFKVDMDSKVHAEEFIGQRVIVNGNAYHGAANTVYALYTTAVGMTSSTSGSRHYPYAAIIMPFNGVVEKVIIKNIQYSSYTSGPSASGTARIQLNQYDSTYAPMDYSSGNVSFTAAANVSMTFSPNESYNEGTHFRVFFNSSAVWRYISYQIILKQTS